MKKFTYSIFLTLSLLLTACSFSSGGGSSQKIPAEINVVTDHCSLAFEKDKASYYIAENVSFTVSSVDEGYYVSSVKANNNVLAENDGKYSFVALNRNDVEALTKPKVANINKEENHGTIVFEKDVYAFGDTIKFDVEWEQHYQAGVVVANGVTLTPVEESDYPYSFTAGLQNVVSVNGDVADVVVSYDVAHAAVNKEKEFYKYGEILKFNVAMPEVCDYVVDYISINGNIVKPIEGEYSYQYVIDNEIIVIKVVEKLKQVSVDSFIVTQNESTVIFDKKTYSIHETVNFTVTPNKFFVVDSVKYNGNELVGDTGKYSFVLESESVEIIVKTKFESDKPIISIEGGTSSFKAYDNNPDSIKLPVVHAYNCAGEEIDPVVTHKLNGVVTTDPGYKTTAWVKGDYCAGVHEWTFTAIDTKDPTKESSLAVTLEVVPVLLMEGKGGSYKMTQTYEYNPKIYLSCAQADSGMEPRVFNIPASKQYYAEITVNKAQQNSGIGLIHSQATSTNDGFVKEYILTENGSTVNTIKAGNWMNGKWAHLMWDGIANKFQNGLDKSGSFNINNWITKDVTLAIARNGNMYYFFIDGQLFEKYSSSDYNGIDSLPGIYFHNCKVGVDGQIMKNVKVLSGTDAVDKINAIDATANQFGYFRNDSYNYTTCSENEGVLTYQSVEGQAIHNSLVASKTLMKGTNHIHFRYECTAHDAESDMMKFSLSYIDWNFTQDPNAKAAHMASWSIKHFATYNTTIGFARTPTEDGWSYEKVCGGDGSTYHWDVATWDVDIYVKSFTKVGVEAEYTLSYTLKEVAYHDGSLVTDPATFSSGDFTGGVKGEYGSGAIENTSFYALIFQGCKQTTFKISNLAVEII